MDDRNKGGHLREKVEAVERLTKLFKVERVVYTSALAFCLAIFFGSVIVGMVRRELNAPEITPMFASGGGAAYTLSRLLHMWNRAMSLLEGDGK